MNTSADRAHGSVCVDCTAGPEMQELTDHASLLAGTPVAVARFDSRGLITATSGGLFSERLLQERQDIADLIGAPLAALWPDVEPLVLRAVLESLIGDMPALEIDDHGRELALLFAPQRGSSGPPVGGICTIIDVSALLARRLLGTSAEDVLTRFSAGLAPLVESIADGLAEDAEPGGAVLVADARERLSAVASDLRAYGGRRQNRPTALAVNRWITEFAAAATVVLPLRVSLVVRTVGGDVPVAVDRGALEHVLAALVQRAADALDAGGTVTLTVTTTPADALALQEPFGRARIEVHDTGRPLTLSERHALLWPFDGSAAPGLSLAAARALVTRARGHISVSSAVDGTRVTVELPLLTRPLAQAASHGRIAMVAPADPSSGV